MIKITYQNNAATCKCGHLQHKSGSLQHETRGDVLVQLDCLLNWRLFPVYPVTLVQHCSLFFGVLICYLHDTQSNWFTLFYQVWFIRHIYKTRYLSGKCDFVFVFSCRVSCLSCKVWMVYLSHWWNKIELSWLESVISFDCC